jgi:hypothetical protein
MTAPSLLRADVGGLGIDLSFQGADQEFASLPAKYARPTDWFSWRAMAKARC